ncbi:MAG: AAA family ATPase, partial [Candidatus Babeliales bacterium]
MIPLKLQIKNFLSYGSKLQTIDFGPYPLICLSGKNGHGKSALLDAMTWAIWGQARKTSGTSKPDAHLLRLGQTSMLVIFDFLFNNQTYRVKREFTATKSGNSYSTVEFGILDATTETFHPLTDKTIRETQKKIECLIGLTFDAFVNTAFLRQGHANEFSKKTPKERKDILASILQLDQYETLRKLTQEEIKKLQEQINHLKFQEEQINTQLQEEQTLVENKATVIRNLETIKQKLDEYQIQLNKLEIQKNALIKKQEEYSLLIYKLDELKKEKVKNEHSLLTLFNEWRTTNKKQHKISNIQEIIQQKELLTQKLFTLQHEQQQILELRERFFKIKELEQQTINNAKEEHLASLKKKEVMIERLNVEHVYLVSKNKELAEQLQLLEQEKNNIGTEQLNVTNHIQKYKELSQQCALIEKQFEKRKNYYHLWVARANSLKQENQGIDQKHLLVKDTSNPSCPLCEQNLSASRKRFL